MKFALWYRCGAVVGAFAICGQAFASSGWSTAATPTKIEIVQDTGFSVDGAFGNIAGCDTSNSLWISISHPQYQELLSVVVTAMASGMKISGYVHDCTEVGWFGPTFNEVDTEAALRLTK